MHSNNVSTDHLQSLNQAFLPREKDYPWTIFAYTTNGEMCSTFSMVRLSSIVTGFPVKYTPDISFYQWEIPRDLFLLSAQATTFWTWSKQKFQSKVYFSFSLTNKGRRNLFYFSLSLTKVCFICSNAVLILFWYSSNGHWWTSLDTLDESFMYTITYA